MSYSEYLKHLIIKTPLEKLAYQLRSLLTLKKKIAHPELNEIYLESSRIDSIIERMIHSESNCIDVGCHLGSMLGKIVKIAPNGYHVAFEPTPYKAKWLRQKFPEVTIHQIALGKNSGQVKFYHNLNRSGFSGLRLHNNRKQDKILEYFVRLERLDKVVNSELKIDFLKIDVEGGELFVLKGASTILIHHRPILLFECTKSGLSCFEITSSEIFYFLTNQHHYSIFLPKDFLSDSNSLSLDRFEEAMEYPFEAFNFIAVPKKYD